MPWERTIFYETHVRGCTMRHPAVREAQRGTFAGPGHDAVIEHLTNVGVTSVVLLPIHTFVDDSSLLEKGLTNYWGYNTGNTLDLSHRRVLQMVTDGLRYWVTEMKVDGFRFDLATILGREPHRFDEGGGFPDACRQDPILSAVKLIAEPWDCGPGGYQVGGFPPGWAEWHDQFRDTVRSYWRGEDGVVPSLATRLAGSSDKFNHRGRRPRASVNFITAHDGFTLNDLGSYADKHNDANGEQNRDGTSDNRSANYRVEGPTDDAAITALRERQKRNLLATLLFAQGTPMMVAGDEFGRTQGGNNNANCQDNAVSWVDCDGRDEHDRALTTFASRLIALLHSLPVLRRQRWFDGQWNAEVEVCDVAWLRPDARRMANEQWNDPKMRCFGMLIDGRAQASGITTLASDATLLLVFTAKDATVDFTLSDVTGSDQRTCLIDTDVPVHDAPGGLAAGHVYRVTGARSCCWRCRRTVPPSACTTSSRSS